MKPHWDSSIHSMKQSPSWEANSHSVIQETIRLLRNPKVHYRVHKSPPIPRFCVTFRNKLFFLRWEVVSPSPNPQTGGPLLVKKKEKTVQTSPSYFFKIHFNIIPPITPWSPKFASSLQVSQPMCCMHVSSLPCVLHASPIASSWI